MVPIIVLLHYYFSNSGVQPEQSILAAYKQNNQMPVI